MKRSTSDLYRATVTKMLRPHQQTIRRGLQDPALMTQISKDAAAQALLHDWENLQDDDGKPIPFSREYARKIFDSHPDFFALVIELAENAELFREDAMGNSPTSSAGS